MRDFLIQVEPYGRSAKNKGIASSMRPAWGLDWKEYWKRWDSASCSMKFQQYGFFFVSAPNARAAVEQVAKMFDPEDRRPLAGVSYVKPLKCS